MWDLQNSDKQHPKFIEKNNYESCVHTNIMQKKSIRNTIGATMSNVIREKLILALVVVKNLYVRDLFWVTIFVVVVNLIFFMCFGFKIAWAVIIL